jgi:DNA-binding SARP family transcriptional activator
MSGLKATLFGKFNIEHGGKKVDGLQARKVQELLSFLLVFRNIPHSREVLSETLWDNKPSSQARKCMRQTVWRLQTVTKKNGGASVGKLLVHDNWIQFKPSSDFWLDIAEFEKVFELEKGKKPRELSASDYKVIGYAVNIYRGDLLEGWYQDWCIFERERFQIMHLMLLDKLVQYCEIHEMYEAGLSYGTKILRHDHAYERTHRQLMRLYYMTGNRTQALRQYERCVLALHNELGVEPSEPTKVLHEQIRLDTFKPSSYIQNMDVSKVKVKTTPALQDILFRLAEVSETLNKIEHQIQEEIVGFDGLR